MTEVEQATDEWRAGLFSYIRVGSHRGSQHLTSSPIASHPTGHYVWDFINWCFALPHGLESFTSVQAEESAVVPFAAMDQGRLFVRVSVQDLSTLQLAYQRGIAALQKAQSKVERLSDENQRLQALVKSWSIKTTALTTESIELRQEISNIKQRMRVCAVPLDDHQGLINLLCEKICCIFNQKAPQPNCGLTFDDVVRVVFTLPSLVQEKLSTVCPSFKDFVDSKNSGLLIRMQLSDAKTTIQRILDLLPLDLESAVLGAVVKEFQVKHGSLKDIFNQFEMRRRSNTDPRDDRLSPVSMTISQSREYNTQFTFSDLQRSQTVSPPKIPERNYRSDVMADSLSAQTDGVGQSPADTSSHPMTDLDSKNLSIKTRYVTQLPETDRSRSSSIGAPIAHSTPCGTISRRVGQRHAIGTPPPTKSRKKKRSRWNFAARFCSNRRTTTISDSDSADTLSVKHATTKSSRTKPKAKH